MISATRHGAQALRWHHLVLALVPGRDALEHVARKYRQIFGVIVIKRHKTATTDQIIVEIIRSRQLLSRDNPIDAGILRSLASGVRTRQRQRDQGARRCQL